MRADLQSRVIIFAVLVPLFLFCGGAFGSSHDWIAHTASDEPPDSLQNLRPCDLDPQDGAKSIVIIHQEKPWAFIGFAPYTPFAQQLIQRTMEWAAGAHLDSRVKVLIFTYNNDFDPPGDSPQVPGLILYRMLQRLGCDVTHHSQVYIRELPIDYFREFDLIVYWNSYGHDPAGVLTSETPFVSESVMHARRMNMTNIFNGSARVSQICVLNNSHYPTSLYQLGLLDLPEPVLVSGLEIDGDGIGLINMECGPLIHGIQPVVAHPNDIVRIRGQNFGDDPGPPSRSTVQNHITFGNDILRAADVTAWNDSSISIRVPSDGYTSWIEVTACEKLSSHAQLVVAYPDVCAWATAIASPELLSRRTPAAAWSDYDNDNDPDVFFAGRSGGRLLRNDGNGAFSDQTEAIGNLSGRSVSAVWGDYDNDGDPDLYVCRWDGPNALYRNEGDFFENVATYPVADSAPSRNAAWLDYDNDGDLDLYLVNSGAANRLLRNDGQDRFSDVTSGDLGDAGDGRAAVCFDVDNDGHVDIYLINNGVNMLFWNRGEYFRHLPTSILSDPGRGIGAACGDYDNDGDVDIYLLNEHSPGKLFFNGGNRIFHEKVFPAFEIITDARDASWGDFDNDGDLDLAIADMHVGCRLFCNLGHQAFSDSSCGLLDFRKQAHGVSLIDYNQDGYADLFSMHQTKLNHLFQNVYGLGNHWLRIDLEGTVSNRDGIGAQVKLKAGGRWLTRELIGNSCPTQCPLTVEFGLGYADRADSIVVRWPSGAVDIHTNIAADWCLNIREQDVLAPVHPILDAAASSFLLHAWPNPFNPRTEVRFTLTESQRVAIAIYSLDGRKVMSLAGQEMSAGVHSFFWDGKTGSGRALASGTYLLRVTGGKHAEAAKLLLIR